MLSTLKKFVSSEEAKNLSDLKFNSGESKLIKEHPYFNYEIIWLLKEVGYEKTYNFLSVDWEKILGEEDIRKKMLFENPLMRPSKDKFLLDMNIYKEKISVEAGEKCRKCGGAETISISKQTASADEQVSIKLRCLSCKFSWRAQ